MKEVCNQCSDVFALIIILNKRCNLVSPIHEAFAIFLGIAMDIIHGIATFAIHHSLCNVDDCISLVHVHILIHGTVCCPVCGRYLYPDQYPDT